MPERDETKNAVKGTKNAALTHGAHNKERGISILSLYYPYTIRIVGG